MARLKDQTRTGSPPRLDAVVTELERASRGLLEVNVGVLEDMEKRIGLAPLRALQALDRRGPSLVTELGTDLDVLASTASRLSDRLAEAGLITRSVAPTNRRATLLELTDAGRAVLDELLTLRIAALKTVVQRMGTEDRAALLRGTRAFTAAHEAPRRATRRMRSSMMMVIEAQTSRRPTAMETASTATPRRRLVRCSVTAMALTLAAATAGCAGRVQVDSSNRGSGSHTSGTSVENAYVVPRHGPGSCAIQVDGPAALTFTITNNRTADAEQLTAVNSDVADSIELSPAIIGIPPQSSVAVGQPAVQEDATVTGRYSTATVRGLVRTATPGMSIPITWHFTNQGELTMRVPIEACPTQR